VPLVAENREAGENPARARHCKRGATRKSHRAEAREGAESAMILESGDLPE